MKINRVSGESLRLEGLSCAQFDVLAQVGARDCITQQGLANALFVTKGNVTQLVDRMEKEGLVERVHEGRKNCLRLTETGTLMYQRVVPA